MLGTANPLSRPTAASLTPAIDIKNGKVGINKRLGTDGSADAGSYELDVNGAIRANGSVDANSARISNGLYVGSSITHNPSGNLVIGNSSNSNYVYFTEDVAASGWSISVNGDISTLGGITTEASINTPTVYTKYLNNVDKISFQSDSPTPGITMEAYNRAEGEYYYNFIGFAPMQENDPAILSNSGYIALYDAGPDGYDGQLTIEDSPTGRISLSD